MGGVRRLGVLFPPCGAEYEYYLYGEPMASDLRIALMGARYVGGDLEHEPRFMRQTAALDNVLLAGRVLKPLSPDAVMWACTSGSFILGLAHAKQQVEALSQTLQCPASSTSLAFVEALARQNVNRVSVLGSYLEETTLAFVRFLEEAGVTVSTYHALEAPSGPQAAALGDDAFLSAARALADSDDDAILVPDTAVPTIHLIDRLQKIAGRTVLTANQVSLWRGVRLTGVEVDLDFWRHGPPASVAVQDACGRFSG